MSGLYKKLVLLVVIVQSAQAHSFYPIDSLELSPDRSVLGSEEYFSSREETSRHDDFSLRNGYPPEYDSTEDYDSREDTSTYSSLYDDPQENDALFNAPYRSSDRKHKREEYFQGLAKKSRGSFHGPARKDLSDDLVARASGPNHFSPRPRSERNKRARLSDYDLYYPKRQVHDEDLRSKPKPQSTSREFDFDDFLYSTSTPIDEPKRPSSGFPYKTDPYSKPSHSVDVEPRRPSGFTYQTDSYSKPSYSEEAEPHRPSSGFTYPSDSYSKPTHSVEPHGPPSGFIYKTVSYSKPSHSVEVERRRPSSGFTYQTDSYSKPFHSTEDEERRPSLETYPTDSYDKLFHSIHDEPKHPSPGLDYYTESYPKLSSTESYIKPSKPSRKIHQRSKRVEEPSLSQVFRSKIEADPSLSTMFSGAKSKDLSSRYVAPRPIKVKSKPKKLSEVQGRNIPIHDDFPMKPVSTSFKRDRRRPGLFTEENKHYLSATGYGKPVREQFHEQGTTGPHSYKFGYNTGDRDNPMARYEERSPDGLVKGSYSYVDPTGQLKVVHYESHPEHGFRTTL